MNITQKQMDEINNIQLNIFKEFLKVCEKLNLRYYAVHGTLLGALKYKGFFPYDDDIDVAMPRKDYEIFIEKGQKLLSKNLFIQCNKTESDYPLVFAKLRNKDTAFIQPVLDKLNINKGIYIDIFPIDYYSNKKKYRSLKKKIFSARVFSRLKYENLKFRERIIFLGSKILCPDWHYAMKKIDSLYKNIKKNENCIVYGGKSTEAGISCELFGEGVQLEFENLKINVPQNYKEYLKIIYGDYENHNPAAKYMISEDLVEISAKIVDVNNSYKKYC